MCALFIPKSAKQPDTTADVYEILIEGTLDASWSDWLDGISLTSLENGQTLLAGAIPDQTALHGLLARIRDLNLKLISVEQKGERNMKPYLLEIKGLETQFRTSEGPVHAVNGVSFGLHDGETLAVVGESGCGKSVTMLSILQLIPSPPGKVTAGKAFFTGRDLLRMSKDEIRRIRGSQIAMIFQDPMTSLNPTLTIERQLTEPLEEHMGYSHAKSLKCSAEMLDLVGIPRGKERLKDYPHQFSGGMRQRVMIAMALSCNPKILIADEPTTALDVTIQAQIVELVKRLCNELNMSIIWITHDLGVVAGLAQRVMVMYGGCIIEEAPVDELYANPRHPYTTGLLGSLPRLNEKHRGRLTCIKGLPTVLHEKPISCPFMPRCSLVREKCLKANPALMELTSTHYVACWADPQVRRITS